MAVVAFDRVHSKLTYSGAYNSLYLLRNGEIIEYKADKMPVGVYIRNDDFALTEINYNPGDTIYLYSDGYADQFGGAKGKKLKSNVFKDYLIQASLLPIEEQSSFLNQKFIEWKGDLDQIDDILVAGFHLI